MCIFIGQLILKTYFEAKFYKFENFILKKSKYKTRFSDVDCKSTERTCWYSLDFWNVLSWIFKFTFKFYFLFVKLSLMWPFSVNEQWTLSGMLALCNSPRVGFGDSF